MNKVRKQQDNLRYWPDKLKNNDWKIKMTSYSFLLANILWRTIN